MIGVCMVCVYSGSAATDPATTSKFLQLGDAERFWFMEGAFRVTAHLIAQTDKVKGDCAANFYLKDRVNRRKEIEKAIAERPDLGETTVIILMLEKACGSLGPPTH